MRILIAGATGAIGRPLVRCLRANQHEVFALTRSPDSAPALEEIGAEPVIGDALDAAAVKATFADWKQRGLTIVQEPVQMDFGHTFVAADPDGHRLRVFVPGAP